MASATATVRVVISIDQGEVERAGAAIDAVLSRYFNLAVDLVGGSGPEATVERCQIASEIVVALMEVQR